MPAVDRFFSEILGIELLPPPKKPNFKLFQTIDSDPCQNRMILQNDQSGIIRHKSERGKRLPVDLCLHKIFHCDDRSDPLLKHFFQILILTGRRCRKMESCQKSETRREDKIFFMNERTATNRCLNRDFTQ